MLKCHMRCNITHHDFYEVLNSEGRICSSDFKLLNYLTKQYLWKIKSLVTVCLNTLFSTNVTWLGNEPIHNISLCDMPSVYLLLKLAHRLHFISHFSLKQTHKTTNSKGGKAFSYI